MVPFRLTQNVVDSFGVAGVEGTFRKAAEGTLQVRGIQGARGISQFKLNPVAL